MNTTIENQAGCEHVAASLKHFLFRKLPPTEDEAVRAHVMECPGCADQLSEVTFRARLDGELPELGTPPLPLPRALRHLREAAESDRSGD